MKNMSRQLLFRVKDKSCLGAQHDSMSSALCHQCHHHITLCMCVCVCITYIVGNMICLCIYFVGTHITKVPIMTIIKCYWGGF